MQVMQPLGEFFAQHSRHLGGSRLVGRDVCVDWGPHNTGDGALGPEGSGWYAGRLVAYDCASGEYTVRVAGVACVAGVGWDAWVSGGEAGKSTASRSQPGQGSL